jgi:tetratricopeptide (TPR) repeat protein
VKHTAKSATDINSHLSDGEIALCAQEMVAGNYPESVSVQMLDHIHQCAACHEAVWELYHLIAGEPTVIEAIRKNSISSIKIIATETPAKGKRKLFAMNKFAYVAATAALLLLLAAVFTFVNQQPVHEKLFTQYYSPYNDVITSKSQAERNLLLDGLFYYKTAQYDLAVAKFVKGLEAQPGNHDLLFYLGSSYLATGNFEQAISSFEQLSEPGSTYYSPVHWYLALAYLGANEVHEARKLLEIIREEGGFYSEKAGKILEQL